jgi:hypothetical protein
VSTPERSTNPVWQSQAQQKYQHFVVRRLPIRQTGALAAAESGLRLLTQADREAVIRPSTTPSRCRAVIDTRPVAIEQIPPTYQTLDGQLCMPKPDVSLNLRTASPQLFIALPQVSRPVSDWL